MSNTEVEKPLLHAGLVSLKDAMKYLGVGRSTLYKVMNRGDLPYAKIGSRRLIPLTALHELAAKYLVTGAPSTALAI